MIGRNFIQRNAIAILAALLAVAVAGSGFLAVRVYGFSVGPVKFEGLQAKAERLAGEAKAASKALSTSEGLRGQEQDQARASFASASNRCDQRITTARDAAAAIEEVTNYGKAGLAGVDAASRQDGRAAVRSIVPVDQLRRIVGQTAGREAAGVPAGGDQPKAQ